MRSCAQCGLLAAHEVFVKTAGCVACQNIGEDIEGKRHRVIEFLEFRHTEVDGNQRLVCDRRSGFDCNRFAQIGFGIQFVARRLGFGRNIAKEFGGRLKRLFGIDIADNDQYGIVGRVILFVPRAQVVGFEGVQIFHVADDGGAHGRLGKGGKIGLFPHFAVGCVFRAQAAFFTDDVHLVEEFFVAEVEVVHAVGFELQNLGQVGGGDVFVIHRFISVGIGIVLSAQLGHAAVEFTGGNVFRAFKHHVFQSVAQAAFARFFIHAADFVPNLRNGHRRAVVFFDDDFQTVGQGFRKRLRP